MTFSFALCALKDGKKVTRRGWNGKGQFVYLVPGDKYPAKTDAAKSIADKDGMVEYRPYFALRTAQGDVATWVPSVSDCLANDWEVVEEPREIKHDDHMIDALVSFLGFLLSLDEPIDPKKCEACDDKERCKRWKDYLAKGSINKKDSEEKDPEKKDPEKKDVKSK